MSAKYDGWKYYNHALVPTSPPHISPNVEVLKDKDIWKKKNWNGHRPLLIRWVEDFDCKEETSWWYCIRDGKYDLNDISRSSRKNINRGLKKCIIRKIDANEYLEAMYKVYNEAFERYSEYDNRVNEKSFMTSYSSLSDDIQVWGGFKGDDNLLIGWITVKENVDYAEVLTAKFYPDYQNTRVSDAMYSTILDYYLNEKNVLYVSSGTRNINHKTNTQEYKEEHFNYRKAYCRLKIVYSKRIFLLVKVLYPFRKLLKIMDKIKIIHLINSLLLMEKIRKGH